MKTIIKILILFLAISGAYTLLTNFTDINFGKIDFFEKHGVFFLLSISLFPRLTLIVSGLLFGSIEFGGLLWWISFFFAPRILIAVLATISYWYTNPILVIFSWLIALGGESSEKFIISKKIRGGPQKLNKYEGTTIDAEYKIKD
jgi:hypothetical protein